MTSQEANSIPLGDILSHYGYEPSRRYGGYDMYRSPFRSDTSPSFKVFREENRWYDFGDGTYGRAVDLVMRVENCSFPQAMKELGRMRTSPQLSMPSIRKPETVSGRLPAAAPMTVLKVIPVQNRHLLDYAASRGIDGEIVRKYCVEVHYCFERNPREKYALGFANDHRGFELRNSMFKGCAYAKDITCISEGNRSCAVFEGFFDLLSFKQKGVEGTSFRWFFYLKDMKTTEFFRENHRNRKNGISFGNLYFRDTAFFSFRPISFSPHSSRSAKVLFSA